MRVGVSRVYKAKANKVHPVDVSGDRHAVDGNLNWKKERVGVEKRARKHVPRGPYNHILTPRHSDKRWGFRLTCDRVQAMDIGDNLREKEG